MRELRGREAKPGLIGRITRSIFRGPIVPKDDRERRWVVFHHLVLHFRPVRVRRSTIRYTHTFGLGGMGLVLFLLLVTSGSLLILVYEPSPAAAPESLRTLDEEVLFGSFVRSTHHWSANLLLLVLFLHLLRVFYTGGYHPPRQFNWVVGLGLMLLVMTSSFTGYLLPWDQLSWADEQAFKAVSLFVGALLTLGSTAAVGNAVAGVVLVYTRAFQVGDWVRIGNTTGEVIRKTLLVTRLRTAACEQVTIPNGEVLRDHVVNFTPAARKGTLGLTASVEIGYDADWRVVEELLLKAAGATRNLSAEPPPFVLTRSLDSFSVSHVLRVATSGPPPLGSIGSELRRNILDEFRRAAIEVLTPTVSVLRQEDQQAVPSPGRPSQMEEDG